MIKRFHIKQCLYFFGSGLGILGIVFVILRLNKYSDQVDFSRFDILDWLIVAGLALVYGIINILLARAWWHLLLYFKVMSDIKWAIKVYGLSQLAKYVPGNIFHLAGRQALGMAAGFPASALAKSSLWELGLITIAGTLFGVLALPFLWSIVNHLTSYVIFGSAVIALIVGIYHWLSKNLAIALFWQILFLAVSGLIFFCALLIVLPENDMLPPLVALCAAYVIAWLAGLVTPGAPAGIGVREAVLLFLLHSALPPADLLLAVLLGRIITVLGDLFYFSISTLIKVENSI